MFALIRVRKQPGAYDREPGILALLLQELRFTLA